MKIKELENQTGIKKTNIRYYEKEGLMTPHRNDENNYREYSEEDLRQLERIKVLRLLGISITDIKDLNKGGLTLEDAVKERLQQLNEEEKMLRVIRKACENILQEKISFETIDEHILEEKPLWKNQLVKLWKEDTKMKKTRKITGMILCTFLFVWHLLFPVLLTYGQTPGISERLNSLGKLGSGTAIVTLIITSLMLPIIYIAFFLSYLYEKNSIFWTILSIATIGNGIISAYICYAILVTETAPVWVFLTWMAIRVLLSIVEHANKNSGEEFWQIMLRKDVSI